MKKFWIVLGALVGLFILYSAYTSFISGNGIGNSVFKVKRQDLTEVISEVGIIVPLHEIDMAFPMIGIVGKVEVQEGQYVEDGQSLISLDLSKLRADVNNAQAAVSEAQASLNKLLAGASPEELQIYETSVVNAQNYVTNQKLAAESEIEVASKNLDAKIIAYNNSVTDSSETLKQAYEDAIDTINDSNTRADTSLGIINYIRELYFGTYANKGREVQKAELEMNNEFDDLQTYIDNMDIDTATTIDSAISEMSDYLKELSEALDLVREALKTESRVTVSVIDEGYIDTERTSISTARTNITTATQAITTASLDSSTSTLRVNSAEAKAQMEAAEANLAAVKAQWTSLLAQAEGELVLANDQLLQIKAPARAEDQSLYKARLNQAIAFADLSNQTLRDGQLTAPVAGVVTQIHKDVGELASSSAPAISLITTDQYKIESLISELDIARIAEDDLAEISFDSFGADEIYDAHVLSIDPFETMEEGDIFYKVTIQLDEVKEQIRSGMTVNISINTADRSDVLVAPSRYVGEEGGKNYVKIQTETGNEEGFERVEVETGIRGRDLTEIISGVKEGDKIIPYY